MAVIWLLLGIAVLVVICYTAASHTKRTEARTQARALYSAKAYKVAKAREVARLETAKVELTAKLAKADETLKTAWSTLLKGGE